MSTTSPSISRSLALVLFIGAVALFAGCAEKEEAAPVPVPPTDATNAMNSATNAVPPTGRQPNPNP